jgi:hypothetical protein
MHHAPVAYHGRNRVLEDQLLLAVVFEQHGIFVEGPDLSGELDAANQINRDRGFVLADGVQEGILNVLCRLVLHVPISFISLMGLDVALLHLRENAKTAGTASETLKPSNPAM